MDDTKVSNSFKDIIKKCPNINRYNENKETFLCTNIIKGNLPNIKFLIENKADINKSCTITSGNSPLLLSIIEDKTNIAKYLIENNSDINYNNNGLTPIIEAMSNYNNDIVTLLLEKKCDINDKYMIKSPLFVSLKLKNHSYFKQLIKAGAEIHNIVKSFSEKSGDNILHCAVKLEKIDINLIKYILELIKKKDVQNKYGNTPLHILSTGRHQIENYKVVSLLIKKGYSVNIKNHIGETPLHLSTRSGCIEITKILIENNADMYLESFSNDTPLYSAMTERYLSSSRRKCIKYLISKGYDINKTNSVGISPIFNAIKYIRPEYPLLKLLINKGCDINTKGRLGQSLIHELIYHHRFCFNRLNSYNSVMHEILSFLVSKIDINSVDHDGNTPLHWAIILRSHRRIIDYLIEKGSNKHLKNNAGRTIFQISKIVDYSYITSLYM